MKNVFKFKEIGNKFASATEYDPLLYTYNGVQ